jgi:hypothetical protein
MLGNTAGPAAYTVQLYSGNRSLSLGYRNMIKKIGMWVKFKDNFLLGPKLRIGGGTLPFPNSPSLCAQDKCTFELLYKFSKKIFYILLIADDFKNLFFKFILLECEVYLFICVSFLIK